MINVMLSADTTLIKSYVAVHWAEVKTSECVVNDLDRKKTARKVKRVSKVSNFVNKTNAFLSAQPDKSFICALFFVSLLLRVDENYIWTLRGYRCGLN